MPFEQGGVVGKPPGPRTILTYLPKQLTTLKESSDSRDRAVALSWIIHLVGDLHQPLHCASRFNADFPDGDQGGNLFVIQPSDSVRQIKLHAFWDAALGSSKSVSTIGHDAKAIMDDDTLQAGSLAELSAAQAARRVGQRELQTRRRNCLRGRHDSGPPPAPYWMRTQTPRYRRSRPSRGCARWTSSDRRAALAAFRLADEIKKAVE